jgi:hypothetical protein
VRKTAGAKRAIGPDFILQNSPVRPARVVEEIPLVDSENALDDRVAWICQRAGVAVQNGVDGRRQQDTFIQVFEELTRLCSPPEVMNVIAEANATPGEYE